MSFFRRNKDAPQIPLPPSRNPSQPNVLTKAPGTGGPPSYRSNASTYNQSRDGPNAYSGSQSYSNGPPSYPQDSKYPGPDDSGPDRYARGNGIGDPYSRAGAGNLNADRNELFAGYNAGRGGGAAGAGAGNRFMDDRPGGGPRAGGGSGRWQDREPETQEEADEDVERISKDTRQIKNESVNSTRNALRLAREAEETARNTLTKLGDQSEKISNTERHLDQSKGHTARAEERTGEIKQLNRSIFIPVVTFNKEGKRQREEARLAARYEDEREERERAMKDVRESHNRIGQAATYGQNGDDDPYGQETAGGRKPRTEAQRAGRSRFQFEKTASDDELEDELDGNLDEIHDVTKRLRALATAQGDELNTQNRRLERLNENAGKLDDRLGRATRNLKRL